jgi:hypothetical protein
VVTEVTWNAVTVANLPRADAKKLEDRLSLALPQMRDG